MTTSMCRASPAATTAGPGPGRGSGHGPARHVAPLRGRPTRPQSPGDRPRGCRGQLRQRTASERRLRQSRCLRQYRPGFPEPGRVPDGHPAGRRRGLACPADVCRPLAEPRAGRRAGQSRSDAGRQPDAGLADRRSIIPNNGEFSWTIPAAISCASDYRVRVTRADVSMSPTPAMRRSRLPRRPTSSTSMTRPSTRLVIWTTAAGDDAHDGLTPAARPKPPSARSWKPTISDRGHDPGRCRRVRPHGERRDYRRRFGRRNRRLSRLTGLSRSSCRAGSGEHVQWQLHDRVRRSGSGDGRASLADGGLRRGARDQQ